MGDLKRKHKPTLQVCSTFSLRLFFILLEDDLYIGRDSEATKSCFLRFHNNILLYFILKTEEEKTKM